MTARASPQPRSPSATAPGLAQVYGSSPSLPQGPRVTKAPPPQASVSPSRQWEESGAVGIPARPRPSRLLPPLPQLGLPKHLWPPEPSNATRGPPPPGWQPPFTPPAGVGEGSGVVHRQTPEMGAEPPRSPRHPVVVFLQRPCRLAGGRQGTGQALLSVRYVQVRGQTGAPPADPRRCAEPRQEAACGSSRG